MVGSFRFTRLESTGSARSAFGKVVSCFTFTSCFPRKPEGHVFHAEKSDKCTLQSLELPNPPVEEEVVAIEPTGSLMEDKNNRLSVVESKEDDLDLHDSPKDDSRTTDDSSVETGSQSEESEEVIEKDNIYEFYEMEPFVDEESQTSDPRFPTNNEIFQLINSTVEKLVEKYRSRSIASDEDIALGWQMVIVASRLEKYPEDDEFRESEYVEQLLWHILEFSQTSQQDETPVVIQSEAHQKYSYIFMEKIRLITIELDRARGNNLE